ncbi:signal peptidase I [Ruminococcus albus]|uniref:Signal peptidase I n=1 Tax=Ruminococcus albus TaxID=1264 RepID=A0A1I1LW22_RUMAL|nr:signal peptidase I [Ruminococcus albus]SFC77289.1 signal peptidase I [Ruminococcus albus]
MRIFDRSNTDAADNMGPRGPNGEGVSSEKHRSPMKPVQIFLLDLLVIIILIWLLFGFAMGAVTAPNNDMSPNIKMKDLLLYYRLEDKYTAQDVVVINKNGRVYIGRIVAVSGDTVNITDDEHLEINGKAVTETNIYTSTPRYEGFVEYPVTLPEDTCFVLSDDRCGGEDSRYYGVVDRSEIKGKVVITLRRHNI